MISISEIDVETIDRIAVNVRGVLLGSKHAVRVMRASRS